MLQIVVAIGAIQVVAALVTLLRSKVLAVLLGPEGLGVMGVIDSLIETLAYVCTLTLPVAALKFLSRSHSRSVYAFQNTYSAFLQTLLWLAVLGALIGLAVVNWRPDLLGSGIEQYTESLLPALIGIPLMVLHGFLANVLASAQRAAASAFVMLLTAISLTLASCVGASVAGLPGSYWGLVIVGTAVAFGLLAYVNRNLGLKVFAGAHNLRTELRENPDILGFSLILYVTSFSFPLAGFVSRYAVLDAFGEAEAGLLHVAIRLAIGISLVVGPMVNLYLVPRLNRTASKEEKAHLATEFQHRLLPVVVALALPMVLFPELLLSLLFSSAFTSVSRVVFLFVTAQAITEITSVYLALLIGFDDTRAYGVIVGVGHLGFGALSWFLAPHFGIAGVALGSLAASVAVLFFVMARVWRAHATLIRWRSLSVTGAGLLSVPLAGAVVAQLDSADTAITIAKLGYAVGVLGSLLLFRPLYQHEPSA